MRNRRLILLFSVFLAAVLVAGCGSRRQATKADSDQLNAIAAKIAQAEQMGAKECAPRELAIAEAELDGVRHEATESWEDARKTSPFSVSTIGKADKAADNVLAKTKACWGAKNQPVMNFMADPATIYAGQCATLKWSSENVQKATLEGVGEVPTTGSKEVCPKETTEYQIISIGPGGTISKFAKVTVNPTVEPMPAPKTEVKIILLEDAHFDFDKSSLTKEGEAILERNIRVLKENPEMKVRIAGYTSASGTEDYNQKLSERRAKTVQDYLVQEGGIAPGRMTKIGYGEGKPAMYEPIPEDINSKAAKANMRVLFEVIVK